MTRNAAAPLTATALFDSADDAWDMPLRREGQVMAEAPKMPDAAASGRPLQTGRGLLTPAEIEALLRPDLSDLPPDPPAAAVSAKPVEDFQTSSPGRLAQDQDLARRFAARLSMAMRESSGLPIAALACATRRIAFDTAVRQGDEERGQAIACFSSPGADIGAMLVLSPGLAQLLIETACGARLRGGVAKPLSPMDLALLDAIVRPLAPALSADFGFSSLETETAFAASIAPPSEAVVIELTLSVQAETFRAQLIVGQSLAGGSAPEPAGAATTSLQGMLSVTLTARVASLAVPLSRLSGLKPGSTLLLGVPADQPIELVSGGDGGVLVAEAEAGRRGNRVALRITRRAAALGPLNRTSS